MITINAGIEIVGVGTFHIYVDDTDAEKAAEQTLKAREKLLAGLKEDK